MREKLTVRDLKLKGKVVLTRVDFNVPLDSGGRITDDSRIRSALDTIRYMTEAGARVVLVSHMGRPRGKAVDNLRMNPVAKRLEELMGRKVRKLDDCVGAE